MTNEIDTGYKTIRWNNDDFWVINQLVKELREERAGKARVYRNRAVIEAVQFYRKYRKLVEG